jgi:1,4-alpha-glucan branching enzyme
LNSDATCYGGDGRGNLGATQADDTPMHGRTHSVRLRLPPLSVLVLSASLSDVETPRP